MPLTARFGWRRYQDYQAKDIPVVVDGGVTVRIMAGESYGTPGPIALRNPGILLDVTLLPGATFTQEVRPHSRGDQLRLTRCSHTAYASCATPASLAHPFQAVRPMSLPESTPQVCQSASDVLLWPRTI